MANRFEGARESARARAERVWKGVREAVADSGGPVVIKSHAGTPPEAAPGVVPGPRSSGRRGVEFSRPSGPAETVAMVVGILVAVALAAGLVWGAVWLLVAFVSWVAGLLGAAGTGLWHLLQAADRAVTPDLIRLGGYLSGPVHAWLERHAGQLPFSVKSMFGGWWALGLFVWWRARRKRGAGVLAFGVWAGATLAVMWAGAEPEARTATLAVAALVASLLVLPLLPYGLFSSHVTVEAPKAPAAKPAVEAGPVVPAPRPAWLAEAVRVVAAVPGGLAPEAVAVRLGRSRDEAVVRAVLRGAAERGELAHREVYVHPDHT